MKTPAWEFRLESHPFTTRTLQETLLGGQAFRWFRVPEGGFWTGIWDTHAASLRLHENGLLEISCHGITTTPGEVRTYLGIDRLEELTAKLPCNADPCLRQLHERWGGLSLLRQPVEETLLAFICSSNKQILQIRSMLHALSIRFGRDIPDTPLRALPTWKRLAEIPEKELRSCALGYRATHVAGTAAFLRRTPDYLQKVASLPTSEARSALCRLPGVGPKVADCVLLFGFGRTEVFPVDTWIARCLARAYPELSGWNREQLATFARVHFGPAAGLAQQWFFADRLAGQPAGTSRKGLSPDRFTLPA